MPPMTSQGSDHAYWRSLNELADSAEFRAFLDNEFAAPPEGLTATSRRQFLKLMGASLAMAGMAGCRWPQDYIAPYAGRPQGRSPGVPVHYATTMELGGIGTGLLAKSFDGRPIKLEGNPDHPGSLGGTNAIQQAAVLDLYDPNRSKLPVQATQGGRENRTWDEFDRWAREHFAALRAAGGRGLCVLSEATSSPTTAESKRRFLAAFPQARWFEYEALSRDNQREGTRIAFDAPHRPLIDFARADIIVSFDDDILDQHPAAVPYTRGFAARRTADDGKMNRLYVIESILSLTGSNADQRYAERRSDVAIRLAQLGAELSKHGLEMPAGAAQKLAGFHAGQHQPEYLAEIAEDILKHEHRGRVSITVGAAQPPEAHALAAAINRALQSSGSAVRYLPEADGARATHSAAIRELTEAIDSGSVDTLVILGGNPAYDAPVDLGMAEKLGKVATTVRLGLYEDETSRLCTWHAPRAHFLESWGDALAWDGTYSIVQPLIAPLYGGRTSVELLATLAGDELTRGYDLTRRTFAERFGAVDWETNWRQALHDGVVAGSAPQAELPALVVDINWDAALSTLSEGWEPARDDSPTFEIAFCSEKLYDGRFANNAWLQELPGLVTKLTWDNAAMLAPTDARRLHVTQDDLIEIAVGGRTLRIPVFVLPGHARGSITLLLGYGRRAGGRVAAEAGFDTYQLRTSGAMFAATGATVQRIRGQHKLATTQDHHAIQSEVGTAATQERIPLLAREGTLKTYQTEPGFVKHFAHSLPVVNGEPIQPFGDHEFEGKPRWAMAIDLAKCTGCSACVTACQAENNVPVVGRDEVMRGREMHWIRVDRYFKGDPEDANSIDVRHQPVACVHCENAPCEQVCPVAATVHDQEGLNVMVYNRCIGTRYCLNNCPYKVRRFNWFFNHHGPSHPRNKDGWFQTKLTAVEKLVFNPEVTVRTRGVMEKCSYCVQRIAAVKIPARNDSREIKDLEIVTACQQACPADAISFGDLNNSSSVVARQHAHNRAYAMLEDLNIRPRTKYLAGLRNPVHDDTAAAADHAAPEHH